MTFFPRKKAAWLKKKKTLINPVLEGREISAVMYKANQAAS